MNEIISFIIILFVASMCLLDPIHPLPIDEVGTPVIVPLNGHDRALLLSWDDFTNDLEVARKMNGITQTSFVITSRLGDRIADVWEMIFRGNDIQSHSSQHVALARLFKYNPIEGERQVAESYTALSKFGYLPILFAYPFGSKSDEVKNAVSRYFLAGRGIGVDSIDRFGLWPPVDMFDMNHDTFGSDGLEGSSLFWLESKFAKLPSGGVFKAYGHLSRGYFSPFQIDELIRVLDTIRNKDVWVCSWSEFMSYDHVCRNSRIDRIESTSRRISFRVGGSSDLYYDVPLAIRIEVPIRWVPLVTIDGYPVGYERISGGVIQLRTHINTEVVIQDSRNRPFEEDYIRPRVLRSGNDFIVWITASPDIKSIQFQLIMENGASGSVKTETRTIYWRNMMGGVIRDIAVGRIASMRVLVEKTFGSYSYSYGFCPECRL